MKKQLKKWADWARKRMIKQLMNDGFYTVGYCKSYSEKYKYLVSIQTKDKYLNCEIDFSLLELSHTDKDGDSFYSFKDENVEITIVKTA